MSAQYHISTFTKTQAFVHMECVGVPVTRNETNKDYGHNTVLIYVVETMFSTLLRTCLHEAMWLLAIKMLFTNQKQNLSMHACSHLALGVLAAAY